MSHFGRNIPNLAKFLRLKFRKCIRIITKSCCCDSVTCLSPLKGIEWKVLSSGHARKKLFHDLRLRFINVSSLANHQNLRLLKRFDMVIDTKTQQNTICLNPLLRLSSSPLKCINFNN